MYKKNAIFKSNWKQNQLRSYLYALSTCVWCKLIKQYLTDNRIAYKFVDVDLLNEANTATANQVITNKGGTITYPTTTLRSTILKC